MSIKLMKPVNGINSISTSDAPHNGSVSSIICKGAGDAGDIARVWREAGDCMRLLISRMLEPVCMA